MKSTPFARSLTQLGIRYTSTAVGRIEFRALTHLWFNAEAVDGEFVRDWTFDVDAHVQPHISDDPRNTEILVGDSSGAYLVGMTDSRNPYVLEHGVA